MTSASSKSKKAFYAFMPMTVVSGFNQLLVPSTINMIMKNFDVDTATAGIIPLIYFLGMLIATLITSHLVSKFTIKQLFIVGVSMVSLSMLIASQITNFHIFIFLFTFLGFGNGILMILPGVYATHHFSEEGPKLQSIIFSFMALGFIIGPMFPGIIQHYDLSWRLSYIIPGLLVIPLLIPIILSNHLPIENINSLSIKVVKEIFDFDKPFFIGIMVICAVGAGSSSAIMTWLITFMEQNRSVEPVHAHLILSGLGVATAFGRRIWGKVASKSTVFKTLVFITTMAMILIFIAPIISNLTVNIVLFLFTVVFISGINPLALSASSLYPKSHSSSVYSLLFSMAAIGGLFLPFLIGVIFHQFGGVVGISSISGLVLIILISLMVIKKEMPISEHINRHILP